MYIINNKIPYIPFHNIFDKDKPSSPCKDCPDRYVGCHSKCNKYIDYKLKLEKYKEEQREKKYVNKQYRRNFR